MNDNQSIIQFPKFLIVGLLGTITNLILFYFLVDVLGLPAIPISILTFIISNFQNYLLNYYWTFSQVTVNQTIGIANYSRYISVSLVALGINLTILWWLLNYYVFPVKVIAQVFGIAGGTVFNYIGSKYWVFRSEE